VAVSPISLPGTLYFAITRSDARHRSDVSEPPRACRPSFGPGRNLSRVALAIKPREGRRFAKSGLFVSNFCEADGSVAEAQAWHPPLCVWPPSKWVPRASHATPG
jgi:hypothetical protein